MMEQSGASDPANPSSHPPADLEAQRIREHLEVVLADGLFSNSKRLPAFLRYVVKEALSGSVEGDGQIKERTLGIMVFGRPANYDSNSDPVVRMTAGEVRKKLAQYYYANHNSDLQIEVPLGSYMPRFRFSTPKVAEHPAAQIDVREPQISVPKQRSLMAFSAVLVVVGVLFAAGLFVWRNATRQTSVDRFWSSFSDPSKTVLIVLPAMARAPQVTPLYHFEAESVAIEDAEVAARLSSEFKSRRFESHMVLATAASLSDLRGNPFVLIGAMDNVWTMRPSQSLPFAFERKDPSLSWTEDFSVPNAQIQKDYGIIARFRDATTEQPTVLVAGISAEGTQAAGEAVTTPRYLDMLLQAAGSPKGGFEAVIETRVIDGRSGPPSIVAMRTW
jgi:hypothetical protein